MPNLLSLIDLDLGEASSDMGSEELEWHKMVTAKKQTRNFHLLKTINPLAVAKNKIQRCVICKNDAVLSCVSCHSFWCSHEHFLLDDESIHYFICSRLAELWFINFNKGRANTFEELVQAAGQNHLLTSILLEIYDMCADRALGYVAESNYLMAIAPSLRATSISDQLYTRQSFEYVRANLLLTKAHMGLRKIDYVTNSLSQLNASTNNLLEAVLVRLKLQNYMYKADTHPPRSFGSVLIEFPMCSLPVHVVSQLPVDIVSLIGQVYVVSGVFSIDMGDLQDGLDAMSRAVYFLSLASGPTSLEVSIPYFWIAVSFLLLHSSLVHEGDSLSMVSATSRLATRAVCRSGVDLPKTSPPNTRNPNRVAASDSCKVSVTPALSNRSAKRKPKICSQRLLEQQPFPATALPLKERLQWYSHNIRGAIHILRMIVDIWSVAVRRAMNASKTVGLKTSAMGEYKNMLVSIQTLFQVYLGVDSFEYAHASLTLAILLGMYDMEFEAYPHARRARKSLRLFIEACGEESLPDLQTARHFELEASDVHQALKFFVTKLSASHDGH